MKNRSSVRHQPVLTALKKAGLKVVEVAEQNKKTVITVSKEEQSAAPKTVTRRC